MRELALHRTLYYASLALSHVFAWILLFDALRMAGSVPAALALVSILYVLAHTGALFLTPLAGMALRNGVRRTLSLAVLCYALALFVLAVAFSGGFGSAMTNAWLGSLGFVAFYALHRALYFAPFEVEASLFGARTRMLREIVLATVPALAAFIVVLPSGHLWVLSIGALLALLSLLPASRLPERYERFEWTYGESFAALMHRPHRRLVFGSFFDGIQGAGLLFFWPLALFFIVSGSYLALGFVFSLTLLLTILARYLLRPYTASTLVWSPDTRATVMLSSWLMRFSAFSPISAAVADTVYYAGSPHRVYALDPLTLEQAADRGGYIDELTTLKEMAYAAGRVCIGLVAAGVALTESIYAFFGVTFAFVVFASLISIYLVRSESQLK